MNCLSSFIETHPGSCKGCPAAVPDGLFPYFRATASAIFFLQHHPTPLAGHRQEKTEKMQSEYEKTDGSAEPSDKTGIISLSDTYEYAGKLF